MEKHICGPCLAEFNTIENYRNHTCGVSSEKPTNPNHLVKTTTPNFKLISEAALARGNKRKELEAQGKTREEAIAETRKLNPVVK